MRPKTAGLAAVTAVTAVCVCAAIGYRYWRRRSETHTETHTDTRIDTHTDTRTDTHGDARKDTLKVQPRSRFRTGQDRARVLCCRSVAEYEAGIAGAVRGRDRVLAVHTTAHSRDPTLLSIRSSAKEMLLFDGKDVWDINCLKKLEPIDVICVNYTDAMGNFLLADSVAMIRLFRCLFEPSLRVIIIKDKGLSRHADSYTTVDGFSAACRAAEAGAGGRAQLRYQEPAVICAVGVSEYRAAIPLAVREGDRVLEIGCARGTTIAEALSRIGDASKGGLAVGIDMGKVCIDNARKDHRLLLQQNAHLRFEVGNGWDVPGLLKLSEFFNVIFVDIGGISGADGEFEGISFVRQLTHVFSARAAARQLRAVVVKSRALRDHAISFRSAARAGS
jgi:hypothetical protein